jgi:hypothetical protein
MLLSLFLLNAIVILCPLLFLLFLLFPRVSLGRNSHEKGISDCVGYC